MTSNRSISVSADPRNHIATRRRSLPPLTTLQVSRYLATPGLDLYFDLKRRVARVGGAPKFVDIDSILILDKTPVFPGVPASCAGAFGFSRMVTDYLG